MTNSPHQRLAAIAERQSGVFTREAARRAGITRDALDYGVTSGRYHRLYPGVYAIAGSPESQRLKMTAAVLSFPTLAAVSHQTAAELLGLTKRGIRQIETVTTRWDRVPRSGLRVHESLDLLTEDVIDLDGVPVTTPVRTVVDLGASNRWMVESALEQGIRQDLFTLLEVEAFVSRVARRGRRGVGVIRPLIEGRRRWDTATESALEDQFRKAVAECGLPVPTTQFVVRDGNGRFVCRADFAYPAERVLIELDSEAHHLDRMTFRRDRTKQNRAVILGWTVLRYTWWDVVGAPGRVGDEVASAINAAS